MTPKLRIDEHVVRKMLKVNPALRAGRTTGQVKVSLERGEPLVPRQSVPAVPAVPDIAGQLRATMNFFLGSKAEALAATRLAIEARKKALDDELAAAKSTLREHVLAFIALLDRRALEAHGSSVLAEHAVVLRELGIEQQVLS